MLKPFSQACENNAGPILEQLRPLLEKHASVLEIGSGTGQHAVVFGKAFPHLDWQTSDLLDNHEGICLWLAEAGLPNVLPPVELDLSDIYDEPERYSAIFSANTLHILSWPTIQYGFSQLPRMIEPDGLLIIYGPFNYDGNYTSESNLRFDQWLKAIDPKRGIRDFEHVDALAKQYGFQLQTDIPMPANNRLLVWRFEG